MKEINVALIGCGYVADGHIRAWKKVTRAKVTAVVDLNETMARRVAEKWKVQSYYTSLSDLIENSRIDLVDISTPPQTHASLAVQAMEAGINILLEKPMTMTVKDAEKIVKCQETTGMKCGVIHNWLFEPPVPDVISLVNKGYIGEVTNIEVEALNTKHDAMAANERHWSHRLPGGRFSEMLAHPIYLVRNFLGEITIKDVHVSKIGDYPWMKSDELCATFKSNNKFGRIYASFNAPRQSIFLNIYGRNAIVKLDLINVTVNILPKREIDKFSIGFDAFRQAAQFTKSTINNFIKVTSGRWLTGHDLYIKLFAQSFFDDSKPPVTVEDGLEVIKILEKMCKKIETEEKKSDNIVSL